MASAKGSAEEPTLALNSYIQAEITRLAASENIDKSLLEGFARFVVANHKKKEPKAPKPPKPPKSPKTAKPAKPKPLTMAQLKEAVLMHFGCADVKALRANKDFQMAMAGEELLLKSRADWLKLYRQWIGVPEDERSLTGPTTINGIDVLENFRPWIAFGLDSQTASVDDVNEVFRSLAKIHHPDHGGDPRVFQQLQVMRDTLLAYFK